MGGEGGVLSTPLPRGHTAVCDLEKQSRVMGVWSEERRRRVEEETKTTKKKEREGMSENEYK